MCKYIYRSTIKIIMGFIIDGSHFWWVFTCIDADRDISEMPGKSCTIIVTLDYAIQRMYLVKFSGHILIGGRILSHVQGKIFFLGTYT